MTRALNRVAKRAAILLGCAGFVALGVFAERSEPSPEPRIAFLSVGQGDCTVIVAESRTILIDAGPANERTNGAARFVVPALYGMSVKTLDLVLITHPDADHMGGLAALARRFKIGKVGLGARFADHPVARQFLNDAGIAPEQMWWINGEHEATAAPFKIRVRDAAPADADDNDGSLLVHVQAGKGAALFTGDASVAMEGLVPPSWKAQVLQAGHHGSRTSTGDALLDRVKPELVVVSCGRDNAYGHPHPEVLDRLRGRRIGVLRTDRQGHIEFRPGPDGLDKVAATRTWRDR